MHSHHHCVTDRSTLHDVSVTHRYLAFDPRCSSQYDYDKLIVYSGSPDSGAHKPVAEYGGNTAGFGSRSVIGTGWPKAVSVLAKGNSGEHH